jgi:osmotically-inducible protein OsmY
MMKLLMSCLLGGALLLAQVSDNLIYDQVRLKLSADRDVRGGVIEVKVEKGVVELSGTVKSDKARNRAEKVAKKVKGVEKVVNKLKVVE